ncbi:MFS transporter [Viridibacillus sp. FSL R5-0477]|jgi:MFS family permease|uniref:Transport protein n=1 Tax=Viridibacillus arenosi FSL R5-213 TaxID=1227360 RepID=W4EQ11_9BACL|nr:MULTISPECIES: MFS transporter [Viridibacillus]ETT82680.1 transport protein [Viridibacillus arenosi FSL R5-213]OMC82344.1 MFS transporter [Viridibacillus sp. FSL H7-0596]OMC85638.1 MFS transporter [Viridibacillus sp. FSL H8-0123]OMC92247.1 MFS transporter [Viridibacillus arenosi]QOV13073.1 MFS transporter [Viridibacillus sp. JNUCC-6]
MPKSVWLLIIGMLVNVTGSSFLWPLNTIYMHDHLGQSLSVAGLVLMANAAAGVVGNLLGGYLFDRYGGYKAIMFGIIVTILGLICLTIWHGWPHYVWFLTLIGFSGGVVFPSMFAMVGTAWPEGGRRGFNAIYLAQNLGVAIGPALAGVVASYSFDYLFSANLLMYVVFFFIAFFGFRSMGEQSMGPTSVVSESKRVKDKSSFIALLIISSGFLFSWIAYSQWTTTISSYTQDLGISLKQYSLLWTVNGLLIVIGQPLINPIVKKLEHLMKAQLVLGISIYIVSFIVVSFAESFQMFMVAIIILTFGEMFVWPAIPTIASTLAPKGRDGFYQGVVNSAAMIGRMVGPFIGGVLADQLGMHIMFIVLTIFLAIAIVPYVMYDRPLKEKKTESL